MYIFLNVDFIIQNYYYYFLIVYKIVKFNGLNDNGIYNNENKIRRTTKLITHIYNITRIDKTKKKINTIKEYRYYV